MQISSSCDKSRSSFISTLQKSYATQIKKETGIQSDVFAKARKAQKIWGQYSFSQRRGFIQTIESYIAKNVDAIVLEVQKATGKTKVDALTTEVISCLLACQWYGKKAEKILRPKRLANSTVLFANKRSEIHHLPMGVVAIISPWNYPLSIPFGEIIMGLMAGNAILLKVASNVQLVGRLIETIINQAKLPSGLFQLVEGSGQDVSNFFFANRVDKIFFTGSVPVGKGLMKQASETLTPLSLELGGNDPMIVLEDANLERASNGACWGAFQNCGQTCAGIERVYVAEKIYDDFLELVIKKTKALRHGCKTKKTVEIGGLTTRKQFDTISGQVEEALQKGAKIVAQSRGLDEENSLTYPATVLIDVDHSMRIMKDETFGPVLCLMSFNSVEEAIFLANDSNLGLTSSVWSKNVKEARKIATKIEAGVTCVNDHLYTHALSETPWGGVKESGLGRTHGSEGLKEMTQTKLINWDLFSGKRNIFWYPVDKNTYNQMKSIITFLHPENFSSFVKGTYELCRFSIKKMFSSWKV